MCISNNNITHESFVPSTNNPINVSDIVETKLILSPIEPYSQHNIYDVLDNDNNGNPKEILEINSTDVLETFERNMDQPNFTLNKVETEEGNISLKCAENYVECITVNEGSEQFKQNEIFLPDAIFDSNKSNEIERDFEKINLPDLLNTSQTIDSQRSIELISDINQTLKADCTTLSLNESFKVQSGENNTIINKDNIPIENNPLLFLQENKEHVPIVPSWISESPIIENRFSQSTTIATCPSFSNDLKLELKHRKALNNKEFKKLCPLSKETAREQMNKYFKNSKSENEIFQESTPFVNKSFIHQQVDIVELPIMKSKNSDKIIQKDLSKYFNKVDSQHNYDNSNSTLEKCRNNTGDKKPVYLNDLKTGSIEDFSLIDKIDVDTLNKQLNKIEQEDENVVKPKPYEVEKSILDTKLIDFRQTENEQLSNKCPSLKNSSNDISLNSNDSLKHYKCEESSNLIKENTNLKLDNKKYLNLKQSNVAETEIHKVKVVEREIPNINKTIVRSCKNNESNHDTVTIINEPKLPVQKLRDSAMTSTKIVKGKHELEIMSNSSVDALDSNKSAVKSVSSLKTEKKKEKCTVS